MNPSDDIEEREGPFEQIAGAADSNAGSSSSDTCSVSFTVAGSLEDHSGAGNYDCVIEIQLTGCNPEDVSFEVTATAVAPNPQNAAGTSEWKFKRDPTDKLRINAMPRWYGSPPNNLCHGYAAPFDLSIKATCPKCVCYSEKKRVQVTLPDASESEAKIDLVGLGPGGAVYEIADPFPVPGIPDHYKCFLILHGWRKNSSVTLDDHLSQYRDMLRKEEEYHIKQFKGDVSFEEGGCGDLWTVQGLKWWLNYEGTPGIPYYGSTADIAKATAQTAVDQAIAQENKTCKDLFSKRHCLIETMAKKYAGFKEAWTIKCAYDECANSHFPPYPAKHPAYAP